MIAQLRRGMTLAELLVVIAIIAVLAMLILSGISTAMRSAERSACMSNLRQVGAACEQFAIENNNRLPLARSDGKRGARSQSWYYQLPLIYDDTNVKGRSVFQCPAFSWSGGSIFEHASPKSYKMNGYLERQSSSGRTSMSARDPSTIVLFADAVAGETGMGQWGHLARTGIDGSRMGGRANVVTLDGAVQTIDVDPDADDPAVEAGLRWTK